MKILLVGGTGLLSTCVAQRLIHRGDAVTLFHRGRTPPRLTEPCRQWIGDLDDAEAAIALIRCEGAWDCVIDTVSGVPERARTVATACAGITRQLIFCSSSNVYPKPAHHYPVREDHPLGAAFASGVGKIGCEECYREAAGRGDFALTIIRPGQIYGETGGVLHSLGQGLGFLDRVRRGLPVVVHGDGTGLWSALHADDIAAIFAAAAGNPVAFNGIYHAMGEEWMTWDRYYAGIAEALGAPAPSLVHVPVEMLCEIAPAAGDQARRSLQHPGIYDMTRARRDFDWQQAIPFVEGMRRTITWLIEHDGIEPWDADLEYERIIQAWQDWREGGRNTR
ncbi:MAG: NAD-dependent epimerase/dehydratase family protein [Armatimonadota bacterium]